MRNFIISAAGLQKLVRAVRSTTEKRPDLEIPDSLSDEFLDGLVGLGYLYEIEVMETIIDPEDLQ